MILKLTSKDQFKNLIEIENFGAQAVKKIGLILVTFLLILSTAIIKNSAKKIEDEYFYSERKFKSP